MKRLSSLFKIVFLLGTVAGTSAQAGYNPVLCTLIALVLIVGLSLLPKRETNGLALSGIDTEIWTPRLIKQLFKNNEFLLRSEDDSQYVDNRTVHKPQEGAGLPWVKNRTLGSGQPTDVNKRTDTVLDYSIDVWTSEPMIVTNAEEVQTSYPKIDSVLNQLIKVGRETISNNMLYNWAASAASTANILRTSGFRNNDTSTAISSANNLVTGATGFRNVFGLYDMKRARTFMLKQNIGTDGWVMVMTPDMYDELIDDMVISKYRDNSSDFNMKEGVINRVMGFDIYVRTTTVTYSNAETPVRNAVGASPDAADNDSALFWSESEVCRAIGSTIIRYNADQAAYYGDLMSAETRMGGSKNRTTEIGVGAIVQSHGA